MPESVNPDDVPEQNELESATVSDVLFALEALQLTVERVIKILQTALLTMLTGLVIGWTLLMIAVA